MHSHNTLLYNTVTQKMYNWGKPERVPPLYSYNLSIRAYLLWSAFVIQVLTESTSYVEALSTLQRVLLTAPAYFIMAGKLAGEGAVVTRDRNFLTDLWVLKVSASVPNSWYILETNYVSLSCIDV